MPPATPRTVSISDKAQPAARAPSSWPLLPIKSLARNPPPSLELVQDASWSHSASCPWPLGLQATHRHTAALGWWQLPVCLLPQCLCWVSSWASGLSAPGLRGPCLLPCDQPCPKCLVWWSPLSDPVGVCPSILYLTPITPLGVPVSGLGGQLATWLLGVLREGGQSEAAVA